jgi:hypothetical protein
MHLLSERIFMDALGREYFEILRGLRYKIQSAPTAEQKAAISKILDAKGAGHGLQPGLGSEIYSEERIVTIDEALEMFQFLKHNQDNGLASTPASGA